METIAIDVSEVIDSFDYEVVPTTVGFPIWSTGHEFEVINNAHVNVMSLGMTKEIKPFVLTVKPLCLNHAECTLETISDIGSKVYTCFNIEYNTFSKLITYYNISVPVDLTYVFMALYSLALQPRDINTQVLQRFVQSKEVADDDRNDGIEKNEERVLLVRANTSPQVLYYYFRDKVTKKPSKSMEIFLRTYVRSYVRRPKATAK